jgi:hypothetical protein
MNGIESENGGMKAAPQSGEKRKIGINNNAS